VTHNFWRRRPFLAAVFVFCVGFLATPIATAAAKLLHATLLSSIPSDGARLTTAPHSLRLVFSEPVVAELSSIALTSPGGNATAVTVSTDPADGRVLTGPVGALPNGRHHVAWRIVSADGHPVAGAFSFLLTQTSPDSALFPPIIPDASPAGGADSPAITLTSQAEAGHRATPKTVSLLRGLGLGAIMAGVGLLFFGSAARNRRNLNPGFIAARFLGFGAILLAAHMGAWAFHISPGPGLSSAFGLATLTSALGLIEAARVFLALLAFWAMAKGNRRLALFLGVACLAVSGALGHSAGIDPMWAIPAKIVHLIGASIWMGGLLWLGWTFRRDITAFRIEARRVSSAALIALIAVAGSGIGQTLLFLEWPWDLLGSLYGRLIIAKISGLVLLILLGAYNRFSLVPNLDDSRTGRKLSRSVTQELLVMLAIILVSGFLANVPVPPAP
jgi:copper transport protein